MLKAQPRFSGNGGHGKRIADADEGIEKAYAPSKQLIAAGRQAEMHAFKTAKPKPLTRNPKKVYNVDKGATKQQLHMADRAWRLTSAGERANARAQSGLKVSMPNAKKAREGVALQRRMVSEGIIKRARTYDSEINRQRRQGMYVAGGALGGGALVASGANDVRRAGATGKEAQQALSRIGANSTWFGWRESQGKRSVLAPDRKKGGLSRGTPTSQYPEGPSRGKVAQAGQVGRPAPHKGGVTLTAAEREAFDNLPKLGSRVSGKAKGKLGAGAALLAGSAGMYRHSRSAGNKRWN